MNITKLIKEYKDLKIEESFNYEEFNKILITSHSTRIEGSTLSFEEASELIQTGNTPGGKPINFSLLTLDHYDALNFVLAEAKKKRPISIEFLKEIASKVMKNTGEIYQNALGITDVSKGDFRKTSVRAGSTTFMSFQKIESAMNSLVEEINSQLPKLKNIESQLLLSFYAHYKMVDIHPFLDGNGRTSRLLMNFIQRSYDLPLGIVFSENKPAYYQALNSVKETESFEAYDDFMFQQYRKHLIIEIEKEKKVRQEKDDDIQPRYRKK
ncbi:MAG: Fic family protein [Capnocytophaga sp.]|nr:Fic family protein [Capnocytophaga sp.]